MGFDGFDADFESRRDFLVDATFCNLLNHFPFAVSEAAGNVLRLALEKLIKERVGDRS